MIKRRRYRYMSCRKTFYDPVPSLHTKRLMTARLAGYVVKRCFTATQIAVARDIGIDEGTVRKLFRDYLLEMKRSVRFETPTVLGIEEIHLSGPRCVLTNIGTRSLFDILPSRTTEKLTPYFQALPDKRKVKLVVADMHRPYHCTADRFFPERPVIVDKFHVIRMANKGLDLVRKKVGRSRTQKSGSG